MYQDPLGAIESPYRHRDAAILAALYTLFCHLGMMRRVVRRIGVPAEHHFAFIAGQRTDKPYFIPFSEHPTRHKLTLMSLLQGTGANGRRWTPSGEPLAGVRSVEHWGASGVCSLVFSQETTRRNLLAKRRVGSEADLAASEQAVIKVAPQTGRLIIGIGDERKVIPCMTDAQAQAVFLAMRGFVPRIGQDDFDLIESVCPFYGLETVFSKGSAYAGRPTKTAQMKRRAA